MIAFSITIKKRNSANDSSVVLNVIILSVIMLNVIMLSVVMLNVVMLSVVAPIDMPM